MQLPVSTYDNEDPSSTARLINCYAEPQPAGARSPVVLRKCPGMKLHQNAVGFVPGKIQNMKRLRTSSGDIVLVLISGQGVYGLKENNAIASSTPEIPFGAEWIDAAADADSVVFVVDPLAYRTVPSGAIYLTSQISDSDFTSRGAGDVEFLDNYFLFREPGTGRFFG